MKLFCDSRCRLGFYFSLLLLLLFFHAAACQEKKEASASKSLVHLVIGEEAPRGRFPYVCSLSRREDGVHRCGGFLIRPQWVVTAAHCVDPDCPGSIGRNPLVRCGIHELDVNDPEKVFSGEQSYWPGSWTGDANDGCDIAVVKLNKEANLTLPSINKQSGGFRSGKLFTALGWGLDETGSVPNSLQMANSLVYMKRDHCKDSLGDAVKNHSICAGFSNENTCKGLMPNSITLPPAFSAEGKLAAGNPELDLMVGVTSIGSEDCIHDPSPTIYTSIGAFWNWILWRIGEDPEEKNRQNFDERTSPDEEEGVKTAKKKRQTEEKTRKEQLERQKIEEERKHMTVLSQKELIKEAYRCTKNDSALKLEAALLEGLEPDSFYESKARMFAYETWRRFTLLHWSAYYNAVKCTEVLLEYGASMNKRGTSRTTPLHVAAEKGHAKVAKVLLKQGVKVDAVDKYGNTPLHKAAAYNENPDVVQLLLDAEADVDAVDKYGNTPLHDAVDNKNPDVVQLLLDAEADVDAVDKYGNTPLHEAARLSSNPEVVQLLLDAGADVDAVDKYGDTPIHDAATHNENPEVVQLLLDAGADVDAVNKYKDTPLHKVALYNENPEVAQLLLDAGADVDAVDKYGNTPLHEAAMHGLQETAKVLVNAGASKTATNYDGKTPFGVICHNLVCSDSTRISLKKLLRP